MKRVILISIIQIGCTFAQLNQNLPEIEWNKTFGDSKTDIIHSLIETSDNGYVLCGWRTGEGAGNYRDVWVLKLNSFGEEVWSKTFGGSKWDQAYSIVQTSDGGYAVCGTTESKGSGNSDVWVLKLSNYGKLLWERTFGGSEHDEGMSIVETLDKGFAIGGHTYSKSRKKARQIWVLKLSSNGELKWERNFGDLGEDHGFTIIQTDDGGYAICGSLWKSPSQLWVLKLNRRGKLEWERSFGGDMFDEAYSIIETSDGGYAVCGYTNSKGAGSWDMWILKLDWHGELIWDQTFGSKTREVAESIIETSDGKYVVCGNKSTSGAGPFDIWILWLTNNGKLLWEKTITGESRWSEIKNNSIVQTNDGGYVIIGPTRKNGHDVSLIKLKSLDIVPDLVTMVETPSSNETQTYRSSPPVEDKVMELRHETLRVAVIEFTEKGNIGIKDAGSILAELMTTALKNTGKFEVYERLYLDKVISESALEMSGLFDEQTIKKIGKMHGVEAIVTGSILRLGDIIVTVKLIDTETARIIDSVDMNFRSINEIALRIDKLAMDLATE